MAADLGSTLKPPLEFSIKDVVSVYLQQTGALNQLWAMYVAATLTGVAFAVTATRSGSLLLVAVTAVGFVAFVAGHARLLLAGYRLVEAAASDIRHALDTHADGIGAATLRRMSSPRVSERFLVTVHGTVDLCMFAVYFYCAVLVWNAA